MSTVSVTVEKVGNIKRYRGRRCIPKDISDNKELQEAIKALPPNYNFEIEKTIWRIRELGALTVALQMPEGLFIFACSIADILERFSPGVNIIIMADAIYGACCVDDFSAGALGVDLLVHYGHSCLVSVDQTTSVKMLYVFVDIAFETAHLAETLKYNFSRTDRIAVMSTVQFIKSLHELVSTLPDYNIILPQEKPLSSCEVLGCTAPKLDNFDLIIFVGDGRFHSEALMIANQNIPLYNYSPYTREIKREYYNYTEMMAVRRSAIEMAYTADMFGIVLGTLGRQGSAKVLNFLSETFEKSNKAHVIVLISEISPSRLRHFGDQIDAWVQVACPRLSMDWGRAYGKPLLTPYEGVVLLGGTQWREQYPMDYYSNNSLGPWTPNHVNI